MVHKDNPPDERIDRLKELAEKLGKGALGIASEIKYPKVKRIPTGIFSWDFALGGGIPAGRINEVWGPKSSCKTTMALKLIASAQKICFSCFKSLEECECRKKRTCVSAWIDAEGVWDEKWALINGVDLERTFLSRPETSEESVDILVNLIQSGDLDLAVFDSLAALSPIAEMEKATEEWQQGLSARVYNKGWRKIIGVFNQLAKAGKPLPTLLVINQMRMKVGVMYGNPETRPGGMGQEFVTSTETKTFTGKYEMDKESGKPLSVEFTFRVDKNKVAPAKIEGAFTMILSDTEKRKIGSLLEEPYLVETGLRFGLIAQNGENYSTGGRSFTGKITEVKKNIINFWLENRDEFCKFKAQLLDLMLRA